MANSPECLALPDRGIGERKASLCPAAVSVLCCKSSFSPPKLPSISENCGEEGEAECVRDIGRACRPLVMAEEFPIDVAMVEGMRERSPSLPPEFSSLEMLGAFISRGSVVTSTWAGAVHIFFKLPRSTAKSLGRVKDTMREIYTPIHECMLTREQTRGGMEWFGYSRQERENNSLKYIN